MRLVALPSAAACDVYSALQQSIGAAYCIAKHGVAEVESRKLNRFLLSYVNGAPYLAAIMIYPRNGGFK